MTTETVVLPKNTRVWRYDEDGELENENTAGWREEIPNEGHHEACALYRKGGHRWPLPSRKGDEAGPFVIRCGWCSETREVDQHGVAWAVSERNPAVSVTSPFSKNAKAPV